MSRRSKVKKNSQGGEWTLFASLSGSTPIKKGVYSSKQDALDMAPALTTFASELADHVWIEGPDGERIDCW